MKTETEGVTPIVITLQNRQEAREFMMDLLELGDLREGIIEVPTSDTLSKVSLDILNEISVALGFDAL